VKTYVWNGLRLHSQIELPLAEAEDNIEDAVHITHGEVPAALDDPQAVYPLFQARPGALLLDVPEAARYLVEQGSRITVQPYPGAGADDVITFLMGSAMAAVSHQRGLLPLHASAVQVGDGCVAFAGASGAGKSTIAAFIAGHGYPLVADDQSVVWNEGGRLVVWPGPGRVKLWKDGLEQLQPGANGLKRVRGRLDKFHVSLARGAAAAPLPLRRLYLMVDGAQVDISPRTGFAAIEAVRQSVYRRHFLQPLGCEQSSFRLCAALASSARIAVLTRPRGFDFLGQVLQELAAEWSLASA
jgi:hypothetical protein